MLAIISAVVGLIGGAAPRIIEYFQDKQDKAHELAIMDKQIQAQADQGARDLEAIGIEADTRLGEALYKHATRKATGIVWVDALLETLNSSVRPVITYAFFGLFAFIEINLLLELIDLNNIGMTYTQIKAFIWDEPTQAMFAMILAFWFSKRNFEKKQ